MSKTNPRLTSKGYARLKGSHCPSCGQDSLNGYELEIDDGTAYQDMECLNCNSSWTDVYKLTGYRSLEIGVDSTK